MDFSEKIKKNITIHYYLSMLRGIWFNFMKVIS